MALEKTLSFFKQVAKRKEYAQDILLEKLQYENNDLKKALETAELRIKELEMDYLQIVHIIYDTDARIQEVKGTKNAL